MLTTTLKANDNTLQGKYRPRQPVLLLCDTTDGAFTVTMPDVKAVDDTAFMFKRSAGTANITIAFRNNQSADGQTQLTIDSDYDAIVLVPGYSNWYCATPYIFDDVTISGLTASRLVATNASSALASVSDLTSWIAGTANRVTVADGGDGTVTIDAYIGTQVISATADITIADEYDGISSRVCVLCDATTGDIVVELPSGGTYPNVIYTVKKIDPSVNTVSVYAPGAEEIDGYD